MTGEGPDPPVSTGVTSFARETFLDFAGCLAGAAVLADAAGWRARQST